MHNKDIKNILIELMHKINLLQLIIFTKNIE